MSAEEKRKERLEDLLRRTKDILEKIDAKEILDEDEYDKILDSVAKKHDEFEKNVSNTIKTTFAEEISKAKEIIAKEKASTGSSKAKKKKREAKPKPVTPKKTKYYNSSEVQSLATRYGWTWNPTYNPIDNPNSAGRDATLSAKQYLVNKGWKFGKLDKSKGWQITEPAAKKKKREAKPPAGPVKPAAKDTGVRTRSQKLDACKIAIMEAVQAWFRTKDNRNTLKETLESLQEITINGDCVSNESSVGEALKDVDNLVKLRETLSEGDALVKKYDLGNIIQELKKPLNDCKIAIDKAVQDWFGKEEPKKQGLIDALNGLKSDGSAFLGNFNFFSTTKACAGNTELVDKALKYDVDNLVKLRETLNENDALVQKYDLKNIIQELNESQTDRAKRSARRAAKKAEEERKRREKEEKAKAEKARRKAEKAKAEKARREAKAKKNKIDKILSSSKDCKEKFDKLVSLGFYKNDKENSDYTKMLFKQCGDVKQVDIKLYDVMPVLGDGDCMFHAIVSAAKCAGTPLKDNGKEIKDGASLRSYLLTYLRAGKLEVIKDIFAAGSETFLVQESIKRLENGKNKLDGWGTYLEMAMIAKLLKLTISVVDKNTSKITNGVDVTENSIVLLWTGSHYEWLRPSLKKITEMLRQDFKNVTTEQQVEELYDQKLKELKAKQENCGWTNKELENALNDIRMKKQKAEKARREADKAAVQKAAEKAAAEKAAAEKARRKAAKQAVAKKAKEINVQRKSKRIANARKAAEDATKQKLQRSNERANARKAAEDATKQKVKSYRKYNFGIVENMTFITSVLNTRVYDELLIPNTEQNEKFDFIANAYVKSIIKDIKNVEFEDGTQTVMVRLKHDVDELTKEGSIVNKLNAQGTFYKNIDGKMYEYVLQELVPNQGWKVKMVGKSIISDKIIAFDKLFLTNEWSTVLVKKDESKYDFFARNVKQARKYFKCRSADQSLKAFFEPLLRYFERLVSKQTLFNKVSNEYDEKNIYEKMEELQKILSPTVYGTNDNVDMIEKLLKLFEKLYTSDNKYLFTCKNNSNYDITSFGEKVAETGLELMSAYGIPQKQIVYKEEKVKRSSREERQIINLRKELENSRLNKDFEALSEANAITFIRDNDLEKELVTPKVGLRIREWFDDESIQNVSEHYHATLYYRRKEGKIIFLVIACAEGPPDIINNLWFGEEPAKNVTKENSMELLEIHNLSEKYGKKEPIRPFLKQVLEEYQKQNINYVFVSPAMDKKILEKIQKQRNITKKLTVEGLITLYTDWGLTEIVYSEEPTKKASWSHTFKEAYEKDGDVFMIADIQTIINKLTDGYVWSSNVQIPDLSHDAARDNDDFEKFTKNKMKYRDMQIYAKLLGLKANVSNNELKKRIQDYLTRKNFIYTFAKVDYIEPYKFTIDGSTINDKKILEIQNIKSTGNHLGSRLVRSIIDNFKESGDMVNYIVLSPFFARNEGLHAIYHNKWNMKYMSITEDDKKMFKQKLRLKAEDVKQLVAETKRYNILSRNNLGDGLENTFPSDFTYMIIDVPSLLTNKYFQTGLDRSTIVNNEKQLQEIAKFLGPKEYKNIVEETDLKDNTGKNSVDTSQIKTESDVEKSLETLVNNEQTYLYFYPLEQPDESSEEEEEESSEEEEDDDQDDDYGFNDARPLTFTKADLEAKTTIELKKIAETLKIDPTDDKRKKKTWIDAILKNQNPNNTSEKEESSSEKEESNKKKNTKKKELNKKKADSNNNGQRRSGRKRRPVKRFDPSNSKEEEDTSSAEALRGLGMDVDFFRPPKLLSIWDDQEDLMVPPPSSFGLADRKAREFMVFE